MIVISSFPFILSHKLFCSDYLMWFVSSAAEWKTSWAFLSWLGFQRTCFLVVGSAFCIALESFSPPIAPDAHTLGPEILQQGNEQERDSLHPQKVQRVGTRFLSYWVFCSPVVEGLPNPPCSIWPGSQMCWLKCLAFIPNATQLPVSPEPHSLTLQQFCEKIGSVWHH